MTDPIVQTFRLGMPWHTLDPFLFCVHHDDAYPAGNDAQGPAASLAGREIGHDFAGKDGWRMYHGDVVPGFPAHPHRGFETVTLARQGFIDHSDSLGARARFGEGDVQWMTAGRGIVHCEMFPLRERGRPNPVELFQIWLNLPARRKMVPPYFTMLWAPTIPRHRLRDDAGRGVEVVTVAGALGGRATPAGPPDSWASELDNEVAIWTIALAPGARFSLPEASPGVNRALYLFRGRGVKVGARELSSPIGLVLRPDAPTTLEGGAEEAELLLLQGRPIGEPVAHHGPFVMNSQDELRQAYADYQRTRFGGWPWPRPDPVHPRERSRFAVHADGREDVPT